MIEIVLSVCMLGESERCKDVKLTYFAESVNTQQCMFNGQLEIAKWIEAHPKWTIKKWYCGERREVADL